MKTVAKFYLFISSIISLQLHVIVFLMDILYTFYFPSIYSLDNFGDWLLAFFLLLPLFILLTLPTYKMYYWSKSKKRTFWLFAYPILLVLPFALFGFFVEGSEAYIVKDLSISWTFYVLFTNLMVVLFLPKKITKKRGDIYLWIGIVGWIIILSVYFVKVFLV